MTTRERNSALQIVLMALAPIAAAALIASAAWSVDAMAAGAPWKFVGLTPQVCPGCAACGLSRAFTAMSHGEFAHAVSFNPSVVLLYPAAWLVALAGALFAARFLLIRSFECRPLRSR